MADSADHVVVPGEVEAAEVEQLAAFGERSP